MSECLAPSQEEGWKPTPERKKQGGEEEEEEVRCLATKEERWGREETNWGNNTSHSKVGVGEVSK